MIDANQPRYAASMLGLLSTALLIGCSHHAVQVQQQPIADSAVRFIMRHDEENALRIAPAGLMFASPDPAKSNLGAWRLRLDLAALGSEREVKDVAWSLVSGFSLDPGAYVELWPPQGSTLRVAPPVHERPGYENISISFGDPWIETQRVDGIPIRVFTVGVATTEPPVEGTYRLRLRGEAIGKRIGLDESTIAVDDRMHEMVLERSTSAPASAASR